MILVQQRARPRCQQGALRRDKAGGIRAPRQRKRTVFQLYLDPVEEELDAADFSLAAVVDHHIVPNLMELVVDPALHDVVPKLVGAFVRRVQVMSRAELCQHAGRIDRLAFGGRMSAHKGCAHVRVATLHLQLDIFAEESLVDVEDKRAGRARLWHKEPPFGR